MDLRVMDVLDEAARRYGSRPAMLRKRGAAWETVTWAAYRAEVRRVARGFMALGLEPGQGVSIVGFNCPEWVWADVGAICAGGMPSGIYTTSSAEQCRYITDHSDSPIAVVDSREQLAKFEQVRGELPKLRAIVIMHGPAHGEGVVSWPELLERGEAVPESALDERIAAQKPDDTATLIYTSGTTGAPKAVMITHRNITWTARALADAMDPRADDVGLSYLPLSHIAEQMTTVHGPMYTGGCVAFAESMEKVPENLREVRPTIFLGVPRVWEKVQARITALAAQSSPVKRRIGAWARKVGLRAGYAEQRGGRRPASWRVANALVFRKVRAALGLDRCRFAATAAAPIARSTLEFFLGLGLPLYEVYGMSECTGPATLSLPGRYRTGKAGFVLPGTQLRIADDGEICMRGPHVFKGYYKDPRATAEALDGDGWLHSGDIGTIDDEGFVEITDRKKELLITAGGENVAPQPIEAQLKAIAAVGQAVVVGDRRKHLAALLTLDGERLPIAAAAAGSPARTVEEARRCERFGAWLQAEIDRVNDGLARVQTIKRWVILDGELTIDGGELTPTMKLKRKVIVQKYEREIASLYDETADSTAA